MFNKVLVANRGEIALRVIRTLRDMGIGSVAVYSDADKDALHVKFADEAVNIGPPLARKSYLNIDNIVAAAKKAGAEAVHPGYGFLAENASFTEACEQNGIKFIGPSAKTQKSAGDKIQAIKMAKKAGVPLLPGSDGVVRSGESALDVATRIGYPVIIKASGGGGGKGMRIANNDEELKKFVTLSIGEASASFGNPDVYIEKYLVKPRHIEFQILADEFGNYVHLGERECSIQRNYQKLVEESPSPFLDDDLRNDMGKSAIEMMRSVGYANAGTVEFLVDADKNFYFNEINSRLQVEHPVTESVTGIDLVRQQILIAAGDALILRQTDIRFSGWSMECRINAEDSENDFVPCPGKIEGLILPGGPNVRIDSALYDGYEIPPFYDSLIGKLIVWGKDRDVVIRRMQRALSEFRVSGIKTTVSLHQRILDDMDFVKGDMTTHFIEEKFG